ncbi:TomO hydrophobic C-terminal domain-containing protein [Wolbachia endosymbiont of Ctenocephalides felis wCfeT]|uniref:TomO hydrophobic C-terminal domain-containing protein n=1 Tax=Wolbachia endosymbiont of Ctenocephalides felis wCfeT TaxID=2732593 RepID=UPI001448028C|nr:hypothetical protein [Wolbachia endosymbiont of Ctenocephalides felis wCfeT]
MPKRKESNTINGIETPEEDEMGTRSKSQAQKERVKESRVEQKKNEQKAEEQFLRTYIGDDYGQRVEIEENGFQGNVGQTSNPNKNNTALQSRKESKLPTIAISTLIVAALASVAFSIYFDVLAVGIAVAACCLVVATLIYCCRPKSSVENYKVEKVEPNVRQALT